MSIRGLKKWALLLTFWLALQSRLLRATDLTGNNLTLTGTADIAGNTLSLGTGAGSYPGWLGVYTDGSTSYVDLQGTRNANNWRWWQKASGTAELQMTLGSDHKLVLYDQSSTPVAMITLDPMGASTITNSLTVTGSITVNGANNQMPNQTLTGTNSVLTEGLADSRYLSIGASAALFPTSGSTATGADSFSLGTSTHATGNYSLASGFYSTASGDYSTALGASTASGSMSIALGQATASGNYSTAMGHFTTAGGPGSTASGWYSTATGTNSTAMGNSTASGLDSTAFGSSTASGHHSFAAGELTTASGNYGGTTFGTLTIAHDSATFAAGYMTTAYGFISTALGNTTFAGGESSTALGYSTTANGDRSTTMGNQTSASAFASVAIGQFNVGGYGTVSGSSWVPADPLLELGNGTDGSHPSDALVVYKNGNAAFQGVVSIAPGGDIPMYSGH